MYYTYMTMFLVDPNDIMIKCPNCKYIEYMPKDSDEIFMHCKNEDCNYVTCLICLAKVDLIKNKNKFKNKT